MSQITNENDALKYAKKIVLESNKHWYVRNEDIDVINLIYREEGQKSNFLASCFLGIFFLPIAILYELIGSKTEIKKAVNISYKDGEILLSGDSSYVLHIYSKLKRSEIGAKVVETKNIEKAKIIQRIKNIFFYSFIILFFSLVLFIILMKKINT